MRLFRTFAATFAIVVVIGIIFLGGYVLGGRTGQTALAQSSGFDVLWQVRDLLAANFLGDIPSAQAQAYGAAHGLVSAFKDPYTTFVEPAPRKLEKAELQGQFGGIGAGIQRNQANEVVLTPNRDGPAAKSGVQNGDVLLKVDGKDITAGMPIDQVVLLLRGDIGTRVTLTLRRAGRDLPLDVAITRAQIQTPSVDWRVLDAGSHTGYVRITLFSERTGQELRTGLADLDRQSVTRLVLDLRGNGGGLLDAAVDTASQFLSEGTVLREIKRGGAETAYPVKPGAGPAATWPIAILTDGGTASASEIVAGALHDYGRATLIGDKTYGKGSVQEVHELADGSSLHVTVARWLTPNRHQIDKTGLSPDVPVSISAEDRTAGRDPQLARAQNWLQGSQAQAAPGQP